MFSMKRAKSRTKTGSVASRAGAVIFFLMLIVIAQNKVTLQAQKMAPQDAREERLVAETVEKTVTEQQATAFNSLGMKFVRIEAGDFMMGDTLTPEEVDQKYPSPGVQLEWYERAQPRHHVTISHAFYMAVTVAEFCRFVNATNHQTTAEKEGNAWGDENGEWGLVDGLSWKNPGFEQLNTHPVVCVSWEDATAFVEWMNKNHLPTEARSRGLKYSLPTEAQWEYACRAGTTTDFFWGDTEVEGEGYLNGAGKECVPNGFDGGCFFPFNDGYKRLTSPVGSFKPNAWGLYDMLGNAFEWCNDWYGDYPSGAVTDPVGPSTGSDRVFRGGGWGSEVGICRSAYRGHSGPSLRFSAHGFRLSLVRDE